MVLPKKELWTPYEFEGQDNLSRTDIADARSLQIIEWHLHFEAVIPGLDEPNKTPFLLANPSHEVLIAFEIDSVPCTDREYPTGNNKYGVCRM